MQNGLFCSPKQVRGGAQGARHLILHTTPTSDWRILPNCYVFLSRNSSDTKAYRSSVERNQIPIISSTVSTEWPVFFCVPSESSKPLCVDTLFHAETEATKVPLILPRAESRSVSRTSNVLPEPSLLVETCFAPLKKSRGTRFSKKPLGRFPFCWRSTCASDSTRLLSWGSRKCYPGARKSPRLQ